MTKCIKEYNIQFRRNLKDISSFDTLLNKYSALDKSWTDLAFVIGDKSKMDNAWASIAPEV